MHRPDVELRPPGEHRLHELERPGIFPERERRDQAGDDHVVTAYRVGGRGEGVDHAPISHRADERLPGHLRRQVDRQVRLVPDHPVLDAREPFERSVVAGGDRGREFAERRRAHLLRAGPRGRIQNVHEGREPVRDRERYRPVGIRPVVRRVGRILGVEVDRQRCRSDVSPRNRQPDGGRARLLDPPEEEGCGRVVGRDVPVLDVDRGLQRAGGLRRAGRRRRLPGAARAGSPFARSHRTLVSCEEKVRPIRQRGGPRRQ